MPNHVKNPTDWQADIERSVADYDRWYLAESPQMFVNARTRAVEEAAQAMAATDDFRSFTPAELTSNPRLLVFARMAVSPPMARDRLVGFSGANKSLVTSMERNGTIHPGTKQLDTQLRCICDFLRPLIDAALFPWLDTDRTPSNEERNRARLVIGERLAAAYYLPVLRNSQEARQKALMREFLEGRGLTESPKPPFEMPPGTFGFGRLVRVVREDGEPQNLPVDCVVAPRNKGLPLACVEMKSAGDYTNVNKRRKEESDKHDSLKRAHGDSAVFLLQLFGYFGSSYLSFESAAGIDWAWDHRLDDLSPYFGL